MPAVDPTGTAPGGRVYRSGEGHRDPSGDGSGAWRPDETGKQLSPGTTPRDSGAGACHSDSRSAFKRTVRSDAPTVQMVITPGTWGNASVI